MVLREEFKVQDRAGRSGSDSGLEKKWNTPVLEVESISSHYTRAAGTYNLSLAACSPHHSNIAEEGLHSGV